MCKGMVSICFTVIIYCFSVVLVYCLWEWMRKCLQVIIWFAQANDCCTVQHETLCKAEDITRVQYEAK